MRGVLREIGAGEVPELVVFNKIDAVRDGVDHLLRSHEGSVAVSAATGDGVDRLLLTIGDRVRSASSMVELVVPYDRGDVLAAIHREGEVLVESHEPDATRIRARLDEASVNLLSEFVVSAADEDEPDS